MPGCPEVYFLCLNMPSKGSTFALQNPFIYAHLQEDVLQFQSLGLQILICDNMSARTAVFPDYLEVAPLSEYVCGDSGDIDERLDHILPRYNQDTEAGARGPELLPWA